MSDSLKAFAPAALSAALLAVASPSVGHGPVVKTAAVTTALAPEARRAAATVDAFHAALKSGDARAASALLADDVLIYESGEVEHSKAEYAGHHLAADVEFTKAVPSTITRRAGRSFGPMAWIASEGRTTGNFNGRPIDSLTTETMVLQRFGKAWRIVQIHWSSAKAR
ncbi:MAG: nuclear transport factor 2 family protein [Sphingomicrobium sp.]